jgi:hypothetical protein
MQLFNRVLVIVWLAEDSAQGRDKTSLVTAAVHGRAGLAHQGRCLGNLFLMTERFINSNNMTKETKFLEMKSVHIFVLSLSAARWQHQQWTQAGRARAERVIKLYTGYIKG